MDIWRGVKTNKQCSERDVDLLDKQNSKVIKRKKQKTAIAVSLILLQYTKMYEVHLLSIHSYLH
jgi:hypothetical protein